MPTYTILDTNTKEESTVFMKWSELEQYLKDNPHFQQILTPIAIGDPYALGRLKTDSVFNERLKTIKKNNPGNTMTTGNLITV